MELNEKLQELRKSKGLTQEELAEQLLVSRTAISKWESGRGYPSIDSLKELSRFFSVTIDELIDPEEILSAAEQDKQESIGRYCSLTCSLLDLFSGLLLFIPVFGNGAESGTAVSLFHMSSTNVWIRAVFASLISLTVLNGIWGLLLGARAAHPFWMRRQLLSGLALSIIGSAGLILARQPYGAIFCFTLLIVKGMALLKCKDL